MDRISIETVKRRLFDIFSDKYEFNFDGYTNTYGKIDVFCKIHGWSQQIVKNLFKGHGCKKCGGIIASNKQRKNIDIIANEFKKVHGNKYDYSKFKYSNNKTNSTIICPQHGEFLQSPWTHLKGHGCPSCSNNRKFDTKKFIHISKNIHKDYIYDFVEYENMHTKVKIVCPYHGIF
jgi:hypothetical protein